MKQKNRVYGLDGLRAIAILGIVFYHMIPNVLPGGFLGVTVFFTIMGYLMIYSSHGEVSLSYALDYYKKKIRRLYPPLLVMLILGLAALFVLVPNYSKNLLPEILSILGGYNNWWQISQNASYFERMLNSSPFTHLWYMGLTIQYYLLWPLIYWLAYLAYSAWKEQGQKRLRWVFLIALAALGIFSAVEMSLLYDPKVDPSRLYYGTDTRAFSLFLGMFIGVLPIARLREKIAPVVARLIAAAMMAVIVASYFLVHGESPENYRYLMQLVSLAFGVLVTMVLLDQKGLGKLADIWPLRIIGIFSYDIYLVMYPVIYFVQKKRGDMWPAVYVLLCVLLIAFFAMVVHYIGKLVFWSTFHFGKSRVTRSIIPVTMLVLCLVITGAQSVISRERDTGDMDVLKDELSSTANNLALINDKQMKTELTAQLSYMNYMLEKETSIIGLASETRMASGAEAASNQWESLQLAAQTELSSFEQTRNNVSVTCLGDSVMLGATSAIQEQVAGAYVSAAVSRQIEAGPEVINTLSEHGILGNVVVVHLGTNGVSSLPKYQAIVDAIGPDRTIYWINCKGVSWANDVNINIQEIVDTNANVNLINWVDYSEGHPEYFYSDGIHLTPEGRVAYAEMIKAAIEN